MLRRVFGSGIFWIVVIGVALVLAQIVATIKTTNEVEARMRRVAAALEPLKEKDLTDAKCGMKLSTCGSRTRYAEFGGIAS